MALEPGPPDSPVLVVVVNDPADLARAQQDGWYRIPLARAPARVAAEWLAFYQTGAFPPGERWSVSWLAPVRAYRLATRRELIPQEPDHARAGDLYYRVVLGPLEAILPPIRSRRLRRITFIPTTLARLREATEINDLWIKSSAQERLWDALKQNDAEAERQYPLQDEVSEPVADFAVFGPSRAVAVIVEDEPREEDLVRDRPAADYRLAAGEWIAVRVTRAELSADPLGWAQRLVALAGGRAAPG